MRKASRKCFLHSRLRLKKRATKSARRRAASRCRTPSRGEAFDLVILGPTLTKNDRHHLAYMVKKAQPVTRAPGHAHRRRGSSRGRRHPGDRPKHERPAGEDCLDVSPGGRRSVRQIAWRCGFVWPRATRPRLPEISKKMKGGQQAAFFILRLYPGIPLRYEPHR